MKPNTRIINYTSLIQDGVLTLDDVPQDIKGEGITSTYVENTAYWRKY